MKNFNLTEIAAVVRRGGRMTPSGKAAIGALLMLTLAMGIGGCSHSQKQVANSNQNSSSQTQSSLTTMPAVPVGPAPLASQPEMAKTKSVKGPVKRLPATRTYNDAVSGLSFTYPRRSTLEVGDKAEKDVVAAEQLPMNFVQPGGITMAVVELPGIAKSGSDYTPAFFAISINKELTSDQCGQFAGQANAETTNSDSADKSASSAISSKLTISGVEYVEFDKQTEPGEVKYFHRFAEGPTAGDNACYEFAMSVKSAEQKQDSDKTISSDVEHKDAFTRLEKILASVNIKGEKKSEVVEAVKADAAKQANTESDVNETKPETAKAETVKSAAKVDENPR
jgi:hypothetical protein